MSQEPRGGDGTEGGPRQFEKNRFFQGKLMTARDMQTEQEYHAERLHTVTRYATGRGVLHGLTISEVEETDDGIEVTIEPGVAIDGRGRPIVVEHTTTKTLSAPSDDELYLFLDHDETTLESVPVPDATGASREEYAANRTVEVFELSARETPPETTAVPNVDTAVDGESLGALADRYHDQYRTSDEPDVDASVFVGAFERTRDGSWTRSDGGVPRHLVYDNEMLYATLVSHLTDTGNPHDTAAGGPPADTGPGDVEEFSQTVQRLQQDLADVNDRLDTLNRYLMRKTLKEKIRYFDDVADRFEEHDTEGGRIARDVVDQAKQGMADEVFDDPEAYQTHVTETLELDISLGEALEESATEASLERYVRAVSELQTALEEEKPVLDVAEAQDQVCEAADSLELLYDIVREQ